MTQSKWKEELGKVFVEISDELKKLREILGVNSVPIHTILVHRGPHMDELVTALYLRQHAGFFFRGIERARIQFVDAWVTGKRMSESEWKQMILDGKLPVGFGGPFDEHGDEPDFITCALTKTIEIFDCNGRSPFQSLFGYVLQFDQQSGVSEKRPKEMAWYWHTAQMMKTAKMCKCRDWDMWRAARALVQAYVQTPPNSKDLVDNRVPDFSTLFFQWKDAKIRSGVPENEFLIRQMKKIGNYAKSCQLNPKLVDGSLSESGPFAFHPAAILWRLQRRNDLRKDEIMAVLDAIHFFLDAELDAQRIWFPRAESIVKDAPFSVVNGYKIYCLETDNEFVQMAFRRKKIQGVVFIRNLETGDEAIFWNIDAWKPKDHKNGRAPIVDKFVVAVRQAEMYWRKWKVAKGDNLAKTGNCAGWYRLKPDNQAPFLLNRMRGQSKVGLNDLKRIVGELTKDCPRQRKPQRSRIQPISSRSRGRQDQPVHRVPRKAAPAKKPAAPKKAAEKSAS